ncbi:MAG: DUF481 domain-containing protein [Campylobacterales bacterium]|nr:DUF481 domain-containing protein [Campylobacterales bacterium]
MIRFLFMVLLYSLLIVAQEIPEIPASGDWIKLESQEWIGGSLKAVYLEKVEFDSYTLGHLSLPLSRIRRLITRQNVTLNARIETQAQMWYEHIPGYTRAHYGTLDLTDQTAWIKTPRTSSSVARKMIVSITPYKQRETEYWNAKATAGLDLRNGNTDTTGFNAIAWLTRRSAITRLRLDYIGMLSHQNSEETANNHRLKQKFDLYMTRSLYLTPLTSELFADRYQNIDYQWRLGSGIGVGLYDEADFEWDLSTGPAIIGTRYHTVEVDESLYRRSWALQIDSLVFKQLEYDVAARFDYRFTLMDGSSGGYRHYLLNQFSRRLVGNVDLDLSLVWNYLHNPIAASDGVRPQKSDFQLLLGIGAGF